MTMRRLFLAGLLAITATPALAQRAPAGPPPTAQAAAPIDLTGQWVSVVTEDWRWRMVTPPVGDTASVPLTPAGQAAAQAWDLEADNAAGQQCRAYGAGGLLRLPLRMRISWQDSSTLRLETDRGQQVRLFHFLAGAPAGDLPGLDAPVTSGATPSRQGETRAQWFKQPQSRGLGYGAPPPGPGGQLRLFTQNLLPGYLRLNGVPYSADATVTETFNLIEHGGDSYLVVTTVVEDPVNLAVPFVTSTNFRRETDRSRWSPSPCHTDAPLEPPVRPGAEH